MTVGMAPRPIHRRTPEGSGDRQWFAVTLLFMSRIKGALTLRPLCEERVVLIRSLSEPDARAKATRYAKMEAHSYQNVYGKTVSWHFVRIEKIERVDGPIDEKPWEVASRFVRRNLRRLHGGDSKQKRR